MQTVKINNTSAVRDIHSKAVLETSHAEYTAHLRRRNREKEVKALGDKMDRILSLLAEKGIDLDGL